MSEKKIRLYFVIPEDIYADFKTQNYLTVKDKVASRIPTVITERVEQYVLEIKLEV